MNTKTFTRILQVNKNGLNAYDLRHLTVNLRARELKLIFNLQSSPMGVLFNNCTLIKSGSKQYTSSRFLPPPPPPPHFLFKEILLKLLTFRYAITRKSEESSRRKSLPVLYTPSVGPSRLRIFRPLIHKEGHWFELLHERRTEPAPL